MLQKGIYPCEYMDDWEKFNETWLPEKEVFYRHLNMEDITDTDYADAKRICKDFVLKSLGEYHDLYLQINTLLLGDVINGKKEIPEEEYVILFINMEKLIIKKIKIKIVAVSSILGCK